MKIKITKENVKNEVNHIANIALIFFSMPFIVGLVQENFVLMKFFGVLLLIALTVKVLVNYVWPFILWLCYPPTKKRRD